MKKWHHSIVRDASKRECVRNLYRWNLPNNATVYDAFCDPRCTSFGERRKSKKTNREFSHSKSREVGGGLMKERDLCIPCKWRAWIIHSNKIMQSAWESRTSSVKRKNVPGSVIATTVISENELFRITLSPRFPIDKLSWVLCRASVCEKCIRNYYCPHTSDSDIAKRCRKSHRQNSEIFRREL